MGKAEDFQRRHGKPSYNPGEERDKKVRYLAEHMPRVISYVQRVLNSETRSSYTVWVKYNQEKRVGLIIYTDHEFDWDGARVVLLEDGTVLKISEWGTDGTYKSPHSSELLEVAYDAHTMAEARRIELAYEAISNFVRSYEYSSYMNPKRPPRIPWWRKIFG